MVLKRFHVFRDNETSNLVDNLLKRLELYAKNLEGLVEERTREYLAEKQKVEDLLHQLLPPSIADQVFFKTKLLCFRILEKFIGWQCHRFSGIKDCMTWNQS